MLRRVRALLIADDAAGIRRALLVQGWDVVLADTSGTGLRRAQADVPDAIVLDADLGDTDGLQVCRLLRRSGNHTPTLMVTAERDTADRIACLNAGADDVLAKPYDCGELVARLRSLVRRNGHGSWGA